MTLALQSALQRVLRSSFVSSLHVAHLPAGHPPCLHAHLVCLLLVRRGLYHHCCCCTAGLAAPVQGWLPEYFISRDVSRIESLVLPMSLIVFLIHVSRC